MGIYTERIAIVLKIRSKLTAFFFAILEDSDIPPTTCMEIREILQECFKDFNCTQKWLLYKIENLPKWPPGNGNQVLS